MNDEVRTCLRNILKLSLPNLERLPKDSVSFRVWKKCKTGWSVSDEQQQVPSLGQSPLPGEHVKCFEQVMSKHHPEYLGFVGTTDWKMKLDAKGILESIVFEIWTRYSSFQVGDDVIATIIEELADLIDATRIRFSYLAPIVNFSVDSKIPEIALPSNFKIQLIDADQMNELYGGRKDSLVFGEMLGPSNIPEYAFVGEFEEAKIFGSNSEGPSTQLEEIYAALRRGVQALRSFKAGLVGYHELHIRSTQFYLLPLKSFARYKEYIPFGRYDLCSNEVALFQAHADQVAQPLHPALELAISRLSDAEKRISFRDKLVDAVIGLEAILLYSQNNELRYRFAMNYSTLFDSPGEKLSRFEIAKDIYDCRSTLVHGGNIKNPDAIKVGNQKFSLKQTADAACEMLREIIKRFLPEGMNPSFCRHNYWEKLILGWAPQRNE